MIVSNPFLNIIINLGIWIVLVSPLLIYFFIKEKKNNPRIIRVDFHHNGQDVSKNIKMGFSWGVACFRWLALFFRFQFIEGLIALSVSFITAIVLTIMLKTNHNPETAVMAVWGTSQFLSAAIIYYYAPRANKILLKKLYKQGCNFDKNTNVEEIYAYIGVVPKDQEEFVYGDVVKGERHNYVVPNRSVEKNKPEVENDNDYSSLTIHDLKLLLRSEGVSFNNTLSKEELLKLVDQYVVKENKEDVSSVEKENKFQKMTMSKIVEELKNKNIEYENSMSKEELIKLLIEYEKGE